MSRSQKREGGPVEILYNPDGNYALALDGSMYVFSEKAFLGLAESMIDCVESHQGSDEQVKPEKLN